MQKVESIKSKLAKSFPSVSTRSLGRVIRFNTEGLDDVNIIELSLLSVESACDVKVKRSGTGLVVIIEV